MTYAEIWKQMVTATQPADIDHISGMEWAEIHKAAEWFGRNGKITVTSDGRPIRQFADGSSC